MAELNVDNLLREFPSQFESIPFYSAESDSLQFYGYDTECYAERVDCWLTVYKEFETHRLIGFKIKNVRILLSRIDALGLDCRVSDKGWAIRLQALIAYIPASVAEPAPQYSQILRSFAAQLNNPLEMVHS